MSKNYIKTTIIAILALGIGFFGGMFYGTKAAVTGENGQVEISKVINLYSNSRSSSVNFDQYWKVWDYVKEKYAGDVNEVDLFYGSLKGMVKALDDPYSKYMPPKESKEFSKSLSGEFEGIGAEIGIRDEQLTIIAPLEGSPAEKAGIKSGDKVLAINGEDTKGVTLEKAVQKIRGEGGTEVTLTVLHEGSSEPTDITITRGKINIPTVKWEMKDQGIAYLQIRYFNQNTWSQFDEAVKNIKEKSAKGIILDLRSNPGGFLKTSIDVASEWVREGVIVAQGNGDIDKRFKTNGAHRLAGIPTVVLVDQGTASGAEIVAGALRDHNAATVIGKQTFGKGSVQDLKVFPDGSSLKLTIAKWYTPSGDLIAEKGIKPDIVLEKMYKETKDKEGKTEDVEDLGMKKAKEVLKNKISN
ncbi:MAG: S41 family peptidase [Candidatus Magasanikbacteria bacterium]